MRRVMPMFLMLTLLLTGRASAADANSYRRITMQEAAEMMVSLAFSTLLLTL